MIDGREPILDHEQIADSNVLAQKPNRNYHENFNTRVVNNDL